MNKAITGFTAVIEEQRKQIIALHKGIESVWDLIQQSHGVAGLHKTATLLRGMNCLRVAGLRNGSLISVRQGKEAV